MTAPDAERGGESGQRVTHYPVDAAGEWMTAAGAHQGTRDDCPTCRPLPQPEPAAGDGETCGAVHPGATWGEDKHPFVCSQPKGHEPVWFAPSWYDHADLSDKHCPAFWGHDRPVPVAAVPGLGDEPVRPPLTEVLFADKLFEWLASYDRSANPGTASERARAIAAASFVKDGWTNPRLAAAQTRRDEPAPALPVGGDAEEVEALCVLFHDAYEAAAVDAGWETQRRSRVPWVDVPEANKATMRDTIAAVLDSGWVAAIAREAAERALVEAADDFQINTWADVVTPALKTKGLPALAVAQAFIDWLRVRAASLGDGSGT